MRRVLLCAAALSLGACMTQQIIEESRPQPAMLELYQLSDTGSRIHIFWHETPYPADTMLRLETPLEQCEHIALYANPDADGLNRLGTEGITVRPSRLPNRQAELARWSRLPEDRCSVLISAGYVIDEAFSGLSFSTRAGVFHRYAAHLSPDKKEEPLPKETWAVLFVEPFMLVTAYPVMGLMKQMEVEVEVPPEWQTRQVTVSFDFPDGRREETTLGLQEAAQWLAGPYYRGTEAQMKAPWRSVRFWVRGALAKLDLDFREQLERTAARPYRASTLVSVNGVEGPWTFDPRDGRAPTPALHTWLADARYLRFSLNQTHAGP